MPIISIIGGENRSRREIINELKAELEAMGYKVLLFQKGPFIRKLLIKEGSFVLEGDFEAKDALGFLEEMSFRIPSDVYVTDEDISPSFKIALIEKERDLELMTSKKVIAAISNLDLKLEIPVFKLKELKKLVKFLNDEFLGKLTRKEVKLAVNEKEIPINPFVRRVIKNVIMGLVSTLKGVEEIKTIQILIKD